MWRYLSNQLSVVTVGNSKQALPDNKLETTSRKLKAFGKFKTKQSLQGVVKNEAKQSHCIMVDCHVG